MNAIDSLLQTSFPSVMVPMRESVVALDRPGERLLIAADGVYLEVVRSWIRVVRRIAKYDVATAIPYGRVDAVTQQLCGPVPPQLIAEFRAMARKDHPVEVMAWIVWNALTGAFRIVQLTARSQGSGHIEGYQRPDLAEGEHLVVDCHSHGAHEAYFSPTDNDDDVFDVKFAFVLGECGSDRPSTAFRLCAKGIFEKSAVPLSWRSVLGAEVA
ncbi:PRTRC system protein A [Paraburkholderia sp. RP-4-7]|uniref:PRTRC system protein A n=1 Tax=Paraburkholderia polaris TaxID=2728848 RepID=A0A848IL19_9BURK|nr:PRTRC system protein A [Paraburkholderia polaris]NMM01556.1 PRTRC system protein A [Paraburkholderia polaris]